ncbi:putative Transmembrane protein [Diplonema papillatum]|nr:putative Transmembrane protein [Diplonema papillatum]
MSISAPESEIDGDSEVAQRQSLSPQKKDAADTQRKKVSHHFFDLAPVSPILYSCHLLRHPEAVLRELGIVERHAICLGQRVVWNARKQDFVDEDTGAASSKLLSSYKKPVADRTPKGVIIVLGDAAADESPTGKVRADVLVTHRIKEEKRRRNENNNLISPLDLSVVEKRLQIEQYIVHGIAEAAKVSESCVITRGSGALAELLGVGLRTLQDNGVAGGVKTSQIRPGHTIMLGVTGGLEEGADQKLSTRGPVSADPISESFTHHIVATVPTNCLLSAEMLEQCRQMVEEDDSLFVVSEDFKQSPVLPTYTTVQSLKACKRFRCARGVWLSKHGEQALSGEWARRDLQHSRVTIASQYARSNTCSKMAFFGNRNTETDDDDGDRLWNNSRPTKKNFIPGDHRSFLLRDEHEENYSKILRDVFSIWAETTQCTTTASRTDWTPETPPSDATYGPRQVLSSLLHRVCECGKNVAPLEFATCSVCGRPDFEHVSYEEKSRALVVYRRLRKHNEPIWRHLAFFATRIQRFPTVREIDLFIHRLAAALAKGSNNRSSPLLCRINPLSSVLFSRPLERKDLPAVAVLFGGDTATSKFAVARAVQKRWPVLIVGGSGGFADTICGLVNQISSLLRCDEAGLDANRKFLSGIDSVTSEIIVNGDLHIIAEGTKTKEFIRKVNNSLVGNEVLEKAWWLYAQWKATARAKLKEFTAFDSMVSASSTLVSLMSVLHSFLLIVWAKSGTRSLTFIPSEAGWNSILFMILQWMVIVLPILMTVFQGLLLTRNPGPKKELLQTCAEKLLSEIYMYRTETVDYSKSQVLKQTTSSAPVYSSAEELLQQRSTKLQDYLSSSEVSTVTMVRYTGRLPPKWIRATGDDGMSSLGPDRYKAVRLDSQLHKQEEKARQFYTALNTGDFVVKLLNALGTLLAAAAAFGLGECAVWVILTVCIATNISKYLDHSRKEVKLNRANVAIAGLQKVEAWWLGKDRKTTHVDIQANRDYLVSETEGVIVDLAGAMMFNPRDARNQDGDPGTGDASGLPPDKPDEPDGGHGLPKSRQRPLPQYKHNKPAEDVRRKLQNLGSDYHLTLESLSQRSMADAVANPGGQSAHNVLQVLEKLKRLVSHTHLEHSAARFVSSSGKTSISADLQKVLLYETNNQLKTLNQPNAQRLERLFQSSSTRTRIVAALLHTLRTRSVSRFSIITALDAANDIHVADFLAIIKDMSTREVFCVLKDMAASSLLAALSSKTFKFDDNILYPVPEGISQTRWAETIVGEIHFWLKSGDLGSSGTGIAQGGYLDCKDGHLSLLEAGVDALPSLINTVKEPILKQRLRKMTSENVQEFLRLSTQWLKPGVPAEVSRQSTATTALSVRQGALASPSDFNLQEKASHELSLGIPLLIPAVVEHDVVEEQPVSQERRETGKGVGHISDFYLFFHELVVRIAEIDAEGFTDHGQTRVALWKKLDLIDHPTELHFASLSKASLLQLFPQKVSKALMPSSRCQIIHTALELLKSHKLASQAFVSEPEKYDALLKLPGNRSIFKPHRGGNETRERLLAVVSCLNQVEVNRCSKAVLKKKLLLCDVVTEEVLTLITGPQLEDSEMRFFLSVMQSRLNNTYTGRLVDRVADGVKSFDFRQTFSVAAAEKLVARAELQHGEVGCQFGVIDVSVASRGHLLQHFSSIPRSLLMVLEALQTEQLVDLIETITRESSKAYPLSVFTVVRNDLQTFFSTPLSPNVQELLSSWDMSFVVLLVSELADLDPIGGDLGATTTCFSDRRFGKKWKNTADDLINRLADEDIRANLNELVSVVRSEKAKGMWVGPGGEDEMIYNLFQKIQEMTGERVLTEAVEAVAIDVAGVSIGAVPAQLPRLSHANLDSPRCMRVTKAWRRINRIVNSATSRQNLSDFLFLLPSLQAHEVLFSTSGTPHSLNSVLASISPTAETVPIYDELRKCQVSLPDEPPYAGSETVTQFLGRLIVELTHEAPIRLFYELVRRLSTIDLRDVIEGVASRRRFVYLLYEVLTFDSPVTPFDIIHGKTVSMTQNWLGREVPIKRAEFAVQHQNRNLDMEIKHLHLEDENEQLDDLERPKPSDLQCPKDFPEGDWRSTLLRYTALLAADDDLLAQVVDNIRSVTECQLKVVVEEAFRLFTQSSVGRVFSASCDNIRRDSAQDWSQWLAKDCIIHELRSNMLSCEQSKHVREVFSCFSAPVFVSKSQDSKTRALAELQLTNDQQWWLAHASAETLSYEVFPYLETLAPATNAERHRSCLAIRNGHWPKTSKPPSIKQGPF